MFWRLLQGMLLLCVMAGCSTTNPLEDVVIGPSYTPENIYLRQLNLPPTIRRVVLLPMTWEPQGAMGVAGQETLEPMLATELGKANRFELVRVRPDQLLQWTGRERWDAQEVLPEDLLEKIWRRTGCEAVMFTHLTRYHPYPPLVVGWRMRLVSAPDGETIWSADEVFDASEATVTNAARRYAKEHVKSNPVLQQSRSILLSPTRFGQYTLSALFETLPKR